MKMKYYLLPIALSLLTIFHYGLLWFANASTSDEKPVTVASTMAVPVPAPEIEEPQPPPPPPSAIPQAARMQEAAHAPVQRLGTRDSAQPASAGLADNPIEVTADTSAPVVPEPGQRLTFQGVGRNIWVSLSPERVEPQIRASASPPAVRRIPSAADLDVMEFFLEVEGGTIDTLVRNVNGAFVRNARYWDPAGRPIESLDRWKFGGRVIQFLPFNGDERVVLPAPVLDAIFARVAASAVIRPVRITAVFRVSGDLQEVHVD
jgi:hypothetical protein